MLTDDQTMIRDTARAFARDRLAPGAMAREAAAEIEPQVRAELGELGFLGMTIAEEWGGVGADYVSYALALEEIAKGDGAVSTMVSVHNAPFLAILDRFASDAQKESWLKPAARGAHIGCFALTESHAGSDASALRTRAVKHNDRYVVNGAKQFISSARIGGATIIFAVTDPEAGKRGLSAFYVANDTPGFLVAKVEEKLGQRASDTCALTFDDMEIPFENRIGEEGEGYRIALSSLETGRIGIAAQAVGMAQAAFDAALSYARERQSFGKAIFDHQAVQFRLADMETQIEAGRQLVLNAARMKDAGTPCLREAAMAKLFTSEMAENVCSAAIQTLGGYGYLSEYGIEKIYRDVRVCQIYEGTSDIQKMLIARQMS
ncbi:acyl-CoA dehydrogenase [Pontibrevibacter nitratireducens]|uniref:3-sulfinopropanoyl-CoA desulfinase n=2 Tax=Pontivivens nitratireducens TaxID=2758038 RepID=A0A6G7VIQ0_9RHOB|nr:acyl-CoA dehydrogenase family protein [Pontibrevibacter nitratireducens]QIK39901.1 acyl-CoA dehydrogenase [Pontibrevibacter nitratireducens]